MQAAIPTPPAPPAITQVEAGGVAPRMFVPGATPTAQEVYQAFQAQRRELMGQLSQIEDKRLAIARRLREGEVSGPDRAGLESRLTEMDQRMSVLGKQVAAADAEVAKAAAVPGAVQVDRLNFDRGGPPPQAFVLGGIFLIVTLLPISLAFARRIWRRSSAPIVAASMTRDMDDRFTRLEQAMDAVAVEVERVGESQRFVAKVLTDDGGLRALGVGAAEPIVVGAREGSEARR